MAVSERIIKAVDEVEQIVLNAAMSDIIYFQFHKQRYIQMAASIEGRCKSKGKLLDIGSHFLHSALILQQLGYEVYGMDVSAFWDIAWVKERAAKYGIKSIKEDYLETMKTMGSVQDEFDVIVFAEIFEHITFNPIGLWQNIYRITRSDGFIYLSTPNSLTLYNMLKSLKNIFLFKGIGLDIEMIFKSVTYGHHWKEYSAHEIRNFFETLSDDFKIKINHYHYKNYPNESFIDKCRNLLIFCGNQIPICKEELEILVDVHKTGNWKLREPQYN